VQDSGVEVFAVAAVVVVVAAAVAVAVVVVGDVAVTSRPAPVAFALKSPRRTRPR